MGVEKRRSFIINFLYFLILALLLYFFVHYGFSVVAPFILAFLVAAVLKRPINFFTRILPLRRKTVAVITTAGFYSLIGIGLYLLGNSAFLNARDLVKILPDFYTNQLKPALFAFLSTVEDVALDLGFSLFYLGDGWEEQFIEPLSNLVTTISKGAVGFLSGAASSLPGFFIKFIFFIISTFFIAIDYPRLTRFCMAQLNDKTKHLVHEIKQYVVGTLWVCLRSYLIIMCITFVELSIGLSIIGVGNAVLIAGVIAIFDVLPVLGTGGIMLPWTVISIVWGHYSRALSLFVLYLIITIIRNIIEPKIVGGQLGLHPVVTLASMFVGTRLFGVFGLFGLPIFLSLLVYLNNNGTISILKKPEEDEEPRPAGESWLKKLRGKKADVPSDSAEARK